MLCDQAPEKMLMQRALSMDGKRSNVVLGKHLIWRTDEDFCISKLPVWNKFMEPGHQAADFRAAAILPLHTKIL